MKKKLRAQYGENKYITDGQYDKSLAVKCVNGTFVGKESEGVIAYKGIPFVGKQPVGEYRWKAPVNFEPDDGVYEAYYNAKSAYQMLELSGTVEPMHDCHNLVKENNDVIYVSVPYRLGVFGFLHP